MMKRWCLIALSLALFSGQVKSQDFLQGDYLILGLGGSTYLQKDLFHSPLTYQGFGALVQLGWHTYKGNWMSNLDLSGIAGISNPNEFGNGLNAGLDLGARIHYSLRYRFLHKGKHAILAGLYSQNFFNYRQLQNFRNSSESYAGFFGYGPSLAYCFSQENQIFSKKLRWSFQSEVNLPFANLSLRPAYTRQLVAGETPAMEHQIFGSEWQLDFRNSLVWHLANGNQIRLNYNWEYLSSERSNIYAFAQQNLNLQFFFKLWWKGGFWL